MKLETNAPLPLLQEEVRTVVEPSLVAKAALIKRWATCHSQLSSSTSVHGWASLKLLGDSPSLSLFLICSVFSYCQGMGVVTPLQNRTVAEVEQGREVEDWSFVASIFSSFYMWVRSTNQPSSLAHSLHSILSVVERPRCLRPRLTMDSRWREIKGRLSLCFYELSALILLSYIFG